jgi:hypothetical protein
MLNVLVVPDSHDIPICEMYENWDVTQCMSCSRFFFEVSDACIECDICRGSENYYVLNCDEKGHLDQDDDVDDIRVTTDYETLFEKTKTNIEKEFTDRRWKIKYRQFEVLMQSCHICDKDLSPSKERIRVKPYIVTSSGDITTESLKIICNVCHRMCNIIDDHNMLVKKCNNIYNYFTKSTGIYYNDVQCIGVCQLKYNDLKRVKKNMNYSFLLNEKEYISVVCDKCRYCGRVSDDININDIIPINNNKVFNLENCTSSCKDCKLLRGTMTESSFVDHINDIVDNTKIRRTNPKKFKIRSDKLRLYAPLNESTGVATDIVFDDLDTNMTWSMEYSDEFTKNFNGLFLTINALNHKKNQTEKENFVIDNGIHIITHIGLSQSNSELIKMSNKIINTHDGVDKVLELIRNSRQILKSNSDILIRVPLNQNKIDVTVETYNHKIVCIEFRCTKTCFDQSNITTLKGVCDMSCMCASCIKLKIHGDNPLNCNCPCILTTNNNPHVRYKLLCNNQLREKYTRKRFLLSHMDYEEQKETIENKINLKNNMISRIYQKKLKETPGTEKYNRKKVLNTRKQKENNNKSKKKEKIQTDPKSRKQKQREKMKETYGEENYKKIVALDTKITRAKRNNMSQQEIDQLKAELNELKQL